MVRNAHTRGGRDIGAFPKELGSTYVVGITLLKSVCARHAESENELYQMVLLRRQYFFGRQESDERQKKAF